MIQAFIDFGTVVRYLLLRDSTIIQYATLDYDDDTLSHMYSLMHDLHIEQVTICMPSYYSNALFNNSVALEQVHLKNSNGFFCMSLQDLQILKHLMSSLGIEDVRITEHRLILHNDGVSVFEFNNLCHVFVTKNGKLVDHNVVIDRKVESAVHDFCIEYGLKTINNFVSKSDMELLMQAFDNVFTVSDAQVLCDLTFMAHLINATTVTLDQVMSSRFISQYVVGESNDNDATEIPIVSSGEIQNSADDAKKELNVPEEASNDENDLEDFNVSAKSKKRRKEAKDRELESMQKPKKSKSFSIALVAILLIMVAANLGMYALSIRSNKMYDSLYAEYTTQSQMLNALEAKCMLLYSQPTSEASEGLYAFLKDSKILKNSTIKLHGFSIEGSTVQVTVSAKSEDDFWDFYEDASTKYNITNVTDGASDNAKNVYVMNLIL